jgi:putative restriction endonuclease
MSSNKPARNGINWTRDESILAFDLYCRIPFKRTKANNPEVIALAKALDRTPASIARKLGNFGAYDPELKRQEISGLSHTSKLDEAIWNEFNADWEKLVIEADQLRRIYTGQKSIPEPEPINRQITGATERITTAKQRIYQGFFRTSVLSGYNQQCCICRVPHREILIASHIVPWSVREDARVNPQNGLCLCASHDLAFERGLIGIGTDFSVLVAERVKKSKDLASQFLFTAFEAKRISLPDRFTPREEFLEWRLERFRERESCY